MDIDTNNPNVKFLYDNNDDVNRQIQEINHIKIYSQPKDSGDDSNDEQPEPALTQVVFLIQNMYSAVEIIFDMTKKVAGTERNGETSSV